MSLVYRKRINLRRRSVKPKQAAPPKPRPNHSSQLSQDANGAPRPWKRLLPLLAAAANFGCNNVSRGCEMERDYFDVEAPQDGDPIPASVFIDSNLSSKARTILMAVHGRPRDLGRPSLDWIMQTCGLSRRAWLSASRELVMYGWLVRRNHGGAGRGKGFRHERSFPRTPIKNPLL